jgi:type I restriction enzyme, S subunit
MSEETSSNVPQIRFNEFYEAWDEFTLSDLGEATSGTSIESEFKTSGTFKVISIGSYSEDSTYTDQGIRAHLTSKTKDRILNEGDLTMVLNDKTSSSRIIGRVLLIPTGHAFVYNQRTQRIEPYLEKFESNFLYQLLNAPLIRAKIINQSQGNTQIYVNWSSIKKSIYRLPKIKEQTQIGKYFGELDVLIGLHQRKHDKLVTLKKAMLQKMFSQPGATTPEIRFKGFDGDWDKVRLSSRPCKIHTHVNAARGATKASLSPPAVLPSQSPRCRANVCP